MRPVRRAAAVLTLAATALVAPLPEGGGRIALAQPLSGATIEASISQRFEADSNYELDPDPAGTSFFSDTRFGFDMTSGTETRTFRLGFDVGMRALWEADEDFEFTYANPGIGFARYEQEWADATFDSYLRLAQRRLSVQSPLDVPGFETPPTLPPDDLTEFDGTERRFDTGFDLALRTDAPSSYRLGFDYTNFDYTDIPAGDAESTAPRYQYTATALWTLRFAPVLSSAVLAEYDYGKADNALENEISVSSLDVGLIYEPSEVLQIATGLGYADRTRNNTIDGETVEIEHDRGPEARAGFVYDLARLHPRGERPGHHRRPRNPLDGGFRSPVRPPARRALRPRLSRLWRQQPRQRGVDLWRAVRAHARHQHALAGRPRPPRLESDRPGGGRRAGHQPGDPDRALHL